MTENQTDSTPNGSFVNLSGSEIGRYRLLQAIGRGGMSTVYRAHDTHTENVVALKVLHPQLFLDRRFPQRFKREASVLRKLEHPHIVPVLDYGQEGDLLYIAMPWMRLGSLNDRLAEGYLSPSEGARLISQIAGALDYAHQQGVIHRDVKPGNILINHQGNALLSDFGFVQLSDASMSLTGSAMIGTPAYISPEQALGDEVTPASDQYALAVILYQVTTGMLPYEADTPIGMAIKHATQPLPPPRSVNPNIPNVVEDVLSKALDKDPGARYNSILAFNEAFQDALLSSVDIQSGRLKRGAIQDRAQTLELSLEEISIPLDEEKRKRHRLLLAAPIALLLLLCPTAYWAYRSLVGIPSASLPVEPVQPTANMTQTAESIVLALVPNGGTGMPTGAIQTAVVETLRVLPSQTPFSMIEGTGTLDATLLAIDDGTEAPGSTASPTLIQAVPSHTPPPQATSTSAPEDTSTTEPTATRTNTPVPSSTPTPTTTPTSTVTVTPSPSNTPTPSPTHTIDICTLIDYQFAGTDKKKLNVRVHNDTGQQIVISSVFIAWPSSNEKLKKVKINGSTIWDDDDIDSPTSFSCSDSDCQINNGTNKMMVIEFDKNAASSGYTLRLNYTNGCTVEEGF